MKQHGRDAPIHAATGFSTAEIDPVLDAAKESAPDRREATDDWMPALEERVVSHQGDFWQLGRHRLICGDARRARDYDALLVGDRVDLIFTDPPYNVPIDGHVSGLGRVRRHEFAMGVGEMSETGFTGFLEETLGAAAATCRDGAIAFVCMDWRHMTKRQLRQRIAELITEMGDRRRSINLSTTRQRNVPRL